MARVRVLRLVAWGDDLEVREAVDKAAVEVAECRKWEYMLGVVSWAGMVAAGYGMRGRPVIEPGTMAPVLRVYGWNRWGGLDGQREWGWFGLDAEVGQFIHLLREGLAQDFFGPGVEYAPARELVTMAEKWPRK